MIPHLLPAVRALMLAAAVAAVLLARRLPSHRLVAVFLASQAIVMVVSWDLRALYLRAAIAAAGGDLDAGMQPTVPLMGWARVAGLACVGAWLAWPAGLAMVSLWCFAERWEVVAPIGERHVWPLFSHEYMPRRWRYLIGPAFAWLAAVAFVAITYPEGRPIYPHLYAGAEVAALVVGLGAAGTWGMRAWGREGLGFSRACVLFMLGCGAVTLAGPYVHGIFSHWWLANAVQFVMYSGLVLAQGGALWLLYRSR